MRKGILRKRILEGQFRKGIAEGHFRKGIAEGHFRKGMKGTVHKLEFIQKVLQLSNFWRVKYFEFTLHMAEQCSMFREHLDSIHLYHKQKILY